MTIESYCAIHRRHDIFSQIFNSPRNQLLPLASPQAIVGALENNELSITLISVNKCIFLI